MQDFFSFFEIPYSPDLDIHYKNAEEMLDRCGDEIFNFEQYGIFTDLTDALADIRNRLSQDQRNTLYCYFLNSVLKTNNTVLIDSVCKPKASAKDELFDTLPLFSLLYEVPEMCKRLEEKRIPQDIIDSTCNMFENQVQDFIDLYGHFGISAYVTWLLRFINNRIIRVGRFNIEITEFGNYYVYKNDNKLCILPDEDSSTDKIRIAKPGDRIISVHIPSGGRLDFEENTTDLKRAGEIVTKCFGEFKLFYCSSWLLDPSIGKIIGKQTNITRFANRFTRFPIQNNGTSVFTYLYHTTDTENFDGLPENTTMQKEIKKHLQSGGHILDYQGVFTTEDLKNV